MNSWSYPNDPQEQISLDIVSCHCRTCDYPAEYEDEKKFCPICGDLIIYQENDGREFTFDGDRYENLND